MCGVFGELVIVVLFVGMMLGFWNVVDCYEEMYWC